MKIIRKVVIVFDFVAIFASFQSCQSMMGGRYAAGETFSYNGQTCKDEYMLGMEVIKEFGANIHQTVTIRMCKWGWLQKRE
jgi:hypothetical protein